LLIVSFKFLFLLHSLDPAKMSGRGRRGCTRGLPENGFEVKGGYMNAKKEKLEQQFKEEKNKHEDGNGDGDGDGDVDGKANKGIFSDIAIFVNGYTGS
jgi:hypothetical protein